MALAKVESRFEGDGEEALLLLYVGANLAGKVEGGGSGAGRRNVVPVLASLLLDGAVVWFRREGFDNCFLTLERDWDDLTLAGCQLHPSLNGESKHTKDSTWTHHSSSRYLRFSLSRHRPVLLLLLQVDRSRTLTPCSTPSR